MAVKKFIAVSPRQEVVPERLGREDHEFYKAVGNPKLEYRKAVCFPLFSILHGYAERGDTIEILVLTAEYEICEINFGYIESGCQEICREAGTASCTVTKISIPFDETLDSHLGTFEKLIQHIKDHDKLYACITFGSKPTPMLEIMTLNYGYRTCRDVTVECIAYGEMNHKTGKKRIFDVTSLFLMDQIVNELGQYRHQNPLAVIRTILNDDSLG